MIHKTLIFFLLIFTTSCSGFSADPESSGNTYGNKWFYSEEDNAPVAILVHGLNNRPSIMDEIAESLASSGLNCLRVSLSDHSSTTPSHNISSDDWLKDLDAAYTEAASEFPGRDTVIIGYSLGGLIALEYNHQNPGRIRSIALIAPPLAIHTPVQLVRLLLPLRFLNLSLPSAAPESYRLKTSTSLNAYHGLFTLYDKLKDNKFKCPQKLQVWLAEDDEIISEKNTREWIKSNCINPGVYNLKGISDYRHSIIDSNSLGQQQFEFFSKKLLIFIKSCENIQEGVC